MSNVVVGFSFQAKRTLERVRIFELVYTNMANRQAHRTVLEEETATERKPAV